jgi:hypothetical protein
LSSTTVPHYHAAIRAQSNPITWWAGVGAFFVALQIYIFASWIGSPHFTPTLPGSSPLPWFSALEIMVIQFGAPALILIGVVWLVVATKQQGRVPTLGLGLLARPIDQLLAAGVFV